MKKQMFIPLMFLTLALFIVGGIFLPQFMTKSTQHVLILKTRTPVDQVLEIEFPVSESSNLLIGVETPKTDIPIELIDPLGNTVAEDTTQDRRGWLERFLAGISMGPGVIYAVNFKINRPIEGTWHLRVTNVTGLKRDLNTYVTVDVSSDISLKAEKSTAIVIGDQTFYEVVAQLNSGDAIMCVDDITIEAEIEGQLGDAYRSIPLQKQSDCTFTGRVGPLEIRDLGFYVIAQQGLIRRQVNFNK